MHTTKPKSKFKQFVDDTRDLYREYGVWVAILMLLSFVTILLCILLFLVRCIMVFVLRFFCRKEQRYPTQIIPDYNEE